MVSSKIDLTLQDAERYSRQILLPKVGGLGQQKLKNATVLVAGAGGLGAHLLPLLAGAGIGRIVVFDFDKVELSNLARQTLYSESDVGRFKVDAAYDKLSKLNSSIKIEVHPSKLDKKSLDSLGFVPDVICDGTDTPITRGLISDFCLAHNIPLVSGAIGGFSGQWITFPFKKGESGPCMRCLYPEIDTIQPHGCAMSGIIGPLCSIIGSMMALETMGIILGETPNPKPALQLWDFFSGRLDKLELMKRKECDHEQLVKEWDNE